MSKDITTEILVKSGFKQNPNTTWIYEMTGTSNFNVAGFGRKRFIEVENPWEKYNSRFSIGNCFKTKEEAEVMAEKFIKLLKGKS